MDTLIVRSGESFILDMDMTGLFRDNEEIVVVDSITCATGNLTFGEPAVLGHIIQFRVSGFEDGQLYWIKVTATSESGDTRIGETMLECNWRDLPT